MSSPHSNILPRSLAESFGTSNTLGLQRSGPGFFVSMREIWRPVRGWRGGYEVSNIGRVRSIDRMVPNRPGVMLFRSGRILRPTRDIYLRVHLSFRGRTQKRPVHQLVCAAFCHKPSGCNVVNHIDFNKHNNLASNLEWVTHSGNTQHSVRSGRFDNVNRGERNHFSKLTERSVRRIRRRHSIGGVSNAAIAQLYSVDTETIRLIVNRLTWRHVA